MLMFPNLPFTQNDNGIFFNVTTYSDTVLTQIDYILSIYEKEKNMIESQMINNNNNNNTI